MGRRGVEHVRTLDVEHTDGTSWSQGGVTTALWTLERRSGKKLLDYAAVFFD